ncbi:hypothetical protein HLB23_01840 [Nocardia uniformis]|uniref:Uncharacterized protein n=1 Tax=Nocardia uniformis TaxID=53432 RepID=A0A849BPY3_9NOCA|nr:hypothetical protein [Nocardia uniformis]NNH68633.1 hypothetical protein [Nocardia uniformis]
MSEPKQGEIRPLAGLVARAEERRVVVLDADLPPLRGRRKLIAAVKPAREVLSTLHLMAVPIGDTGDVVCLYDLSVVSAAGLGEPVGNLDAEALDWVLTVMLIRLGR